MHESTNKYLPPQPPPRLPPSLKFRRTGRLAGKIWLPALVAAALAVAYLGIASAYDIWPFGSGVPLDSGRSDGPSLGTTGDTASWQTYRNREFGFEVKYPNTLEPLRGSAPTYHTVSNNICFAPGVRGELSCEFEVYVMDASELKPEPFWVSGPWGDSCSQRPTPAAPVLDGVKGNQVQLCRNGEVVLKNVWVIENNQVYLFAVQEVGQSKLAQFDQILSTFKFIEPETDTSNWKMYRNEEFGFEVKYPGDHTIQYNKGENGFLLIIESRLLKHENGIDKADFVLTASKGDPSLALEKYHQVESEEDTIIDGVQAIERLIAYSAGYGKRYSVIFKRGDFYYVIVSYEVELFPIAKERFNQILSTFKFIK